ncbi:ROK family transcriptional regulator [Frigoribacterium sp. CFBP 8751]|jgi:predicted NBD/HSP70 family sugar kinase|nr:ROK family transcriptional regulator [Frigoribacterium sp. CFBP 8751]MBD8538005.1 ROK family transcriptional regulator [Frigoribacterium sp. CFBP 8751]
MPRREDAPVTTTTITRQQQPPVRAHNRSLVLEALYRDGSMSRADLARRSGLTRPTVSALVAELIDDGIARELGVRDDARVGKPATLVGIESDAFHIVTVDLSSADRFVGAVVDLRGGVVERAGVELEGAVGEAAVSLVERLVDDLRSRTTRPLLGVGVATPGIVDHDGIVRTAVHLGWYDLPLRSRLADHVGLPVHVGNDSNAAAVGIRTFGETAGQTAAGQTAAGQTAAGQGASGRAPAGQSLMVVTIDHGVGVGLVVAGSLVEGDQFSAGEIGHVTVDENGDVCACGRRGCLEEVLAAPQLRARLLQHDEGSRGAVLHDAGRALGLVLAPIISALNIDEVVLSGPADLVEGALLRAARDTVRQRTLSAVSNGLTMSIAGSGTDLALRGAASFVLQAELGLT